MTFTQEIKEELCKTPAQKACCANAECLGILLYANQFTTRRIRIQSESRLVRRRVEALFGQAFDIRPFATENVLEITDAGEIARIYAAFGYEYKDLPLQLNRGVIDEDCCKNAFLRGMFLSGGYVSTKGKGYHLELVTTHYHVARQVSALLMDMELTAGSTVRRGNYVLYYKNSAAIEDFLSAAGATGSAMRLMLKKVERDLRNNVNRKVNCETANVGKTVEAAARQIAAIAALEEAGMLEDLPEPLRRTAVLRRDNPELSLSELCALVSPPISKPGLNNRLRKLVQLAEDRCLTQVQQTD